MGVLKFRLTPPDLASRLPGLRKAYVTGLDRTPGRSSVEIKPGVMAVHRESPESGRLFVPWPIAGFGEPIVGTATLAERAVVYDLAVELARGKLNDVRNQTSDWRQMGLPIPAQVEALLGRSQAAFARAATSREAPEDALKASAQSLEAASGAARGLVEAYTAEVLSRRRDHSAKLPTLLVCGLDGATRGAPWLDPLADAFNAARLRLTWNRVAPDEGKHRWDEPDAQLAWARKKGLTVTAGPLIEFRKGALPDWLWLWDGDFEEIQSQALDYVKAAVTRYKGKVAIWHIAHRVAEGDVLGMAEEEQVRLTAGLLQAARRIDPNAEFVVDFDRPWGEWMATSAFQLGPLHLADSLARAEIGLGGVGLEIAPGFSSPGGHLRDLLDFSRLLDLFSLVNLPVHVSIAMPSAAGPDPKVETGVTVEAHQWPRPPDEALQREWGAAWMALAVAKPFVRSVTWLQAGDAAPHLYPHAGLVRPDGKPKPLFDWIKKFRGEYLS